MLLLLNVLLSCSNTARLCVAWLSSFSAAERESCIGAESEIAISPTAQYPQLSSFVIHPNGNCYFSCLLFWFSNTQNLEGRSV